MTKASDNVCRAENEIPLPFQADWGSVASAFWSPGAFSILHPKKDGLTEQQTKDALQIEKDILSANLPQLKLDMQAHAGHGEEFKQTLAKVTRDLKAKGIVAGYETGKMMWGDEHAMHSEGYLAIIDKKGLTALEVSTDPRMATLVEPVKKLDSDSYSISRGLYVGPQDPAATLRSIAGITGKTLQPHRLDRWL